MKIRITRFKDQKSNIPFVHSASSFTQIFIVLPQVEYDDYGHKLVALNRHKCYTRDMFKFNIINADNYDYSRLGKRVLDRLHDSNILVRLMNETNGEVRYAMGQIDFTQTPEEISRSLRAFVCEVCKENEEKLISQLEAGEGYGFVHNPDDAVVQELIKAFHSRANNIRPDRGILYNILCRGNLANRVCSCECKKAPMTITKDDIMRIKKIVDGEAVTPEQREHSINILTVLEQLYDTEVANEVYAEVKPVEVAASRTRRAHTEYGIEFTSANIKQQIRFGNKAAAVIYISTMLCKKAGLRLCRKDFLTPIDCLNSTSNDKKVNKIIRSVYERLFPNATNTFEVWFSGFCGNGHKIDMGKSHCNSEIKKMFTNTLSIVRSCEIQSKKGRSNNYYDINIPAENIILPFELSEDNIDLSTVG